jgi:hypothetical protein
MKSGFRSKFEVGIVVYVAISWLLVNTGAIAQITSPPASGNGSGSSVPPNGDDFFTEPIVVKPRNQPSSDKIAAIAQNFEDFVSNLVQHRQGEALTQGAFSCTTFGTQLYAPASEVKAALLRAGSLSKPKWRVEREEGSSSDRIVYYMRPRMLLGSSLYNLVVQTYKLPDGYLDIRGNLVGVVLTDPDPDYSAKMQQWAKTALRSFTSNLRGELHAVTVKGDTILEKSPTPPTQAGQNTQGNSPEVVKLIETAITARGGREVLDRFKICKVVSTVVGTANGKNFTMRETEYLELPDRLRMDQEVVRGTKSSDPEIFYILGDKSLTVAKGAFGLPKKMTREGEAGLRRELDLMNCFSLIPLLSSDYKLEKWSGRDGDPVMLKAHCDGKLDVTLLFEHSNGALVGFDFERPGKGGHPITAQERFGDFQNFSGLMFPKTMRYSEEGIETTSTVESVVPLDAFPEPGTQ